MAQFGIFRAVRPSIKRNPAAVLPLGQWRSKPANDDERVPANDDQPNAAEIAPSPS